MGIAEHKRLLDMLTERVRALADSDLWRAHLVVQSRFHRYSFNNAMLIGTQYPEATRVAGFTTWKKLGRSVCAGERAIWILAPMIRKRTASEESEEIRSVYGFRPVPVFDLAQTEGDPLPELCPALKGDDPDACFELLQARAERLGFSVELTELSGSTNGDCNFALRRIRVESGNSPAQRVKTLAHELAHALLHQDGRDRALAELEAESTAFVVCRSLGIDSSGYSFGYVASWGGGGPEAAAKITSSGTVIQRAASAILDEPEPEPGSSG